MPESLNDNATTNSINDTESIDDGIQYFDPITKTNLQCPFPDCDFETSRKNSLDLHIKSHTSCKHCGEDFPGKRQLTVHLTTHKQKKKQLCQFCSKEFKDRSNRWKHEKTCKKAPGNIKERPKSVHPVILFPQDTPKVLPPKKAPGSSICACCNNDFSYLCRKDLNEHRQMCNTNSDMMVEPELLIPSMTIKEEIDP